jgi:uncharacterized membrane protein SpoIIM required for sporulation
MSAPAPESAQFRREREGTWRRLEAIVRRAESAGTRSLSAEDLLALPALHRATLSSLSVARAISLDRNLLEYLEGLAQRAYFVVYGTRRPFAEAAREFLVRRFPQAVRGMAWPLLLAAAVTLLGMATAWAACAADPERYYDFVDEGLAGGRGPAASREGLRAGLYDEGHEVDDLGFFASFLFTHNARVAMTVFALGFLFGVPTFVLLFVNGLMLGAFGWLFGSRDLGWDFWGWVLPHGVTELLAVLLAGAAGFALAGSVAFPGRRTALDSAALRGREAGAVMLGVIAMLVVAGLLEGFFRQLVTSPGARWSVALLSAALWAAYLGLAGRRRAV